MNAVPHPVLLFERIIAVSEAMIEAARRGDWEAIHRLDDERNELLAAFPEASLATIATAHADKARRLIALDEQITGLVARALDNARQNLLSHRRASSAIDMYQDRHGE